MAATLFAAGGAIATSGSGPAEAQGEPDGEAIYQANCAVCHGAEGEGGVGPVLQGIIDAHGPEDVEQSIRTGVPPLMPSWEGTLSDAEIEAVMGFLATLEGQHGHEHDHDDEHDDEHDDGHGDDHGDGAGDEHDDGHGDDHGDDPMDQPPIGTPAPPIAGDPGFTG